MTLEHLAAIRWALPDAQVAVVPGTSHALTMEKPHVVNQLLLDFLADEQVAKLLAHAALPCNSVGDQALPQLVAGR